MQQGQLGSLDNKVSRVQLAPRVTLVSKVQPEHQDHRVHRELPETKDK